MFHLTFCGGSQVRLKDEDNIVITFWGGTDILLPTIAEKIMRMKKVQADDRPGAAIRRTNVITFQAATSFSHPTMAREIEEMTHLRDSAAYSEGELRFLWQEALKMDDMDTFEMVTIMAGAGEEWPSMKTELYDLERIAAKGLISLDELNDFREFLLPKSKKKGAASTYASTLEMRERIKALLFPLAPPQRLETARPKMLSNLSAES